MRKILKNLVYDTETAKYLASFKSRFSVSDFNYYKEDLYIKKTGEYFLYGTGGPASKYNAPGPSLNSYVGSEKIIPLSYEEARQWAEDNLEAEEYEEIFGEVSEGEEVNINVKISASTKDFIDNLRSKKGYTISEIIEKSINLLKKEVGNL